MHAALLLIGNELLSGKVTEANMAHLARTLRAHGVALSRAVVVKDELEELVEELNALRKRFRFVFTSGGVGPTHDDVTMEAVAKALGRKLEVPAALRAMLLRRYGDALDDAHLRMALAPENAELLTTRGAEPSTGPAPGAPAPELQEWPLVRAENLWILPGVPEAFRMKLEIVATTLRREHPRGAFHSLSLYTQLDEPALVPLLSQVVSRFGDVEVGSYPKWFEPAYRTKLTFDGLELVRVEAARAALASLLPPESIVRLD